MCRGSLCVGGCVLGPLADARHGKWELMVTLATSLATMMHGGFHRLPVAVVHLFVGWLLRVTCPGYHVQVFCPVFLNKPRVCKVFGPSFPHKLGQFFSTNSELLWKKNETETKIITASL